MKNQYDALDSLIQSTHFANKKAKPAETFYEGKIGDVLQQFEKTEDGSYKRVARSMVADRVARGHAAMEQLPKDAKIVTANTLETYASKFIGTSNDPTRRGSKTEAAFDSKPNALEAYAAAHAVKAGDNIRIGQTILNQLGANKFTAMTGAKRFVWLSNGVQFDIPVANKINRVTVRLTPTDEYDVEFGYMRGMDYKVVKKVDGIQAAELQNTFTNATGLRTRL